MRRALALAVLVAGLAAGWLWWGSDRRRIQARFDEAMTLFEKSGPESQLDAFARVRGIVGLFAPGFVAMARPYEGTITDAQQLAAVVASYRSSAERIAVSDGSRELVLQPERATAEMVTTVTVDGIRGGRPGRERFRLRLAWREDDGAWRIQELEVLEVLETGGGFF
jgi:hypothetical protein